MAEDTNCNGRVIVQREIWMGSKGGVPRIRQRWGLRVWGSRIARVWLKWRWFRDLWFQLGLSSTGFGHFGELGFSILDFGYVGLNL